MGSLNHSHCLIGAWSPPINGGSDSGKTFGSTFGAFSITPSQIVMESAIRHKTKYQVVERNLHMQVAEIALCRLLMRLSTSKKVALKSVLQLNVS